MTAYYDEPQNWMWGPPQAALSHQFADTGDGYGFLIESAQATTGLFAGALPVALGRRPQAAHARSGRTRPRSSASPASAATAGSRSTPPATRSSTIRSPTRPTSATLKLAVEQLVRVHEAAGAREIVAAGMKAPDWARGDDLEALHRGAQRARDRARAST